ncbi:LRR receptor-like serine/threonine-protein kinase EFR [Capsicum annuum]|uniref:LRR receptor-like serine/threonine-protein kinase EFR n=1 Tax=Capsicum annuum TaxID=4072 RepID=UPI001FB153EE|nr:LRR receptor-like serine/threonine-protein kinase EFR [Capsicum annuum]
MPVTARVPARVMTLSGNLHNGLCNGLPKLQELHLSENKLHGHMSKSLSNCSQLQKLSLSENVFDGPINSGIGRLANLQMSSLGSNHFTSMIYLVNASAILSNYFRINLYYTLTAGIMPQEIGDLVNLMKLGVERSDYRLCPNLHFQHLISAIFVSVEKQSQNLTYLSLSFNPLNSMLPVSAVNLSTSLIKLYAGSCRIKGRVSNVVGNLSNLIDIDLSEIILRLDVIDLTQNQFSGSLPNCLGNVTSLGEIHLGSNILSSNIPPSLGNLKDLVVLDLSSNNMVGSLPPQIGNLKAVTLIDLSMNRFSNRIPKEIGGLQNLVHLSLRNNELQGSMPDSMNNMFFNVSENKLYSEIPSGGPFKNLLSQFFIYNEALCGSSRFSVPPCLTSSEHKSNRKRLLAPILLLGIALLYVTITFVFVLRYRRGKRTPQQADSLSTIIRERISYYELLQATDALSESNLIGSGSFSSVYKGTLTSGNLITVKVFNLKLEAAFKSFDTECEVLRGLRHRNLVKVITSCSNLDLRL